FWPTQHSRPYSIGSSRDVKIAAASRQSLPGWPNGNCNAAAAIGHCQVASSGRVMGKTSNAGVRLQAQVRQHRATCRTRHCEPAILVGIEEMTTELEMIVDPTVGGQEALRMTR